MSVPSNAVSILNPQIPVDQSIYETSTTQKAKLGTRLQVGERVFYYAVLSTSANVAAGELLCAPQLIASHQSGIMTAKTTGTGATVITFTAGTLGTVNQYAEGYVAFASTGLAGCGLYKIKANAAWATAATTANITLYDPIPGSLAAQPVNLVPCMFKNVLVGTNSNGVAMGVAPVSVTTGEYFWIQTYGPAAVKHEGATVAAGGLALGTLGGVANFIATGTLGATGSMIADYLLPIGKNFNLAATATQANPVFLTILP